MGEAGSVEPIFTNVPTKSKYFCIAHIFHVIFSRRLHPGISWHLLPLSFFAREWSFGSVMLGLVNSNVSWRCHRLRFISMFHTFHYHDYEDIIMLFFQFRDVIIMTLTLTSDDIQTMCILQPMSYSINISIWYKKKRLISTKYVQKTLWKLCKGYSATVYRVYDNTLSIC